MKPHELAKRLNIADITLRKWAGNVFAEFLSPSAVGPHRSFMEQDARVLTWVAQLKSQNVPTADILTMLRAAQAEEWRTLPPLPLYAGDDVALVPREAVEERVHALEERYRMQLTILQDRIEQTERERNELKAEKADLREENKRLNMQVIELTKQSLEVSRTLAELLASVTNRRRE